MIETKLLLDIVTGLRSLADSLQAVAEASTCEVASRDDLQVQPAQAQEPKPTAKAVILEQVRAVLAEKSMDGLTSEVRGLLEKHGAKKLSEIDPSIYLTLLAEAEALK